MLWLETRDMGLPLKHPLCWGTLESDPSTAARLARSSFVMYSYTSTPPRSFHQPIPPSVSPEMHSQSSRYPFILPFLSIYPLSPYTKVSIVYPFISVKPYVHLLPFTPLCINPSFLSHKMKYYCSFWPGTFFFLKYELLGLPSYVLQSAWPWKEMLGLVEGNAYMTCISEGAPLPVTAHALPQIFWSVTPGGTINVASLVLCRPFCMHAWGALWISLCDIVISSLSFFFFFVKYAKLLFYLEHFGNNGGSRWFSPTPLKGLCCCLGYFIVCLLFRGFIFIVVLTLIL